VTYEYAEGLCPRAEEILQRLVCIPLDETWNEEMVDRAAAAIREAVAAGTGSERAVSRRVVSGSAPSAMPDSPGTRSADRKQGTAIVDRRIVRVGIVGCGQMGQWHLDAYRRLPDVELVAVADENVARARAFANQIGAGASAHASYTAMLESAALDAVSICTPPSTHRAVALAALEAGAHVLCEKPLAATLAEAEEMAAAAARGQRVLLTAFKFRFFDEVARVRDLIARGLLGDIVHARLVFGGFIDMSGSWYADPALSGGGVLFDNGPHAFDLARHLLGGIVSIEASVSRHQPIDVEDTVNVHCELARGGVLTIVMSWSLPVPARHYLELYGTQGTALLELGALTYRLRTWSEWKRVAGVPVKDGFARQVEHFVAAVRGCAPTRTTLEDGVEAQRLVEAAYRSLRTGRTVAPVLEDDDEGMALDRRPTAAQSA
jgi:predicted dehydrogenase